MNGYRDNIEMDRTFPFQINEVLLRSEDSAGDTFHWHTFFEITCVLTGSGCYYAGGQSFEVSEGDLIIFNNAELHGWQVLQREMKVLVLIFTADLVAGYGDSSDSEYLKPFIERGSNFKNKIGRDEPYARQIASIMEEIRWEWLQQGAGCRLMIKADVLRILTMLIRHYNDAARTTGRTAEKNKALRRLQRAFEYIDAGYCGKLTLKEAADAVFMSPNYFSHYFHAATGISFSDYVTLRRIRKARELLETTGKSIYEIAIECGFPNSSNFYRLYKKHTGQSPRKGL